MARLLADGSNASPVLSNVAVTSPISEHGIATLSGDISDADAADAFALTVDWGDGFAAQVFTYPAGTTSFSVQRQYDDDNPTATSSDSYAIALTLGDSGGRSDTDAASVTVNNLAPSVSGIAAVPATITVGGTTNVSGTVTRALSSRPHRAGQPHDRNGDELDVDPGLIAIGEPRAARRQLSSNLTACGPYRISKPFRPD